MRRNGQVFCSALTRRDLPPPCCVVAMATVPRPANASKMAANPWSRVVREVKGHKPFCFGIRAKFPKPNVAGKQLIIWREQERIRHEAEMHVKAHQIGQQMNEMEELDERKRLHRLVQQKVDMEMQCYLTGEEERRKRETSEELRTQWSQKHMLEVCEDRLAQLALKEELNKQKAQEEAAFAALWEADRLAKEKRAMEDDQKRSRRNDDMLNMLNTQQAIAEAQRQEERRLKEEEAKLMQEDMQLMKLENERAEIERRRKLRECGSMLLESMKEKRKRFDEEREEELALEMKILDHILQESLEDTESQRQRKKELLKEQQTYRAYLAQQREEEKQREKEMDKLRAEDSAKMWAKRAEKAKALKTARDGLLREVMDTRRLQIEEKLQRNAREQEELFRDRELLNEAIQEHKRQEDEQYVRSVQQAKKYREDLKAQMDYINRAHASEKEELQREYEMAQEVERLLQEKIADVLSRPYMRMKDLHPLRRHLVSSSQS
uniref:Cilia- and flagella-associated protein 53 n=2 Tax=Anolis carolinensis TaxID=28377 RepID=A0A803TQS3_ANOCA|nr:PREDICTED: cilia- and flagella-associated protein 53 isoform X2 [Anolis carolinensis]|eukprot:XP_016852833.1 PREDICTED: cilia- and flagella-associated protein 53 isoform X2 [Anolis carolinensis]